MFGPTCLLMYYVQGMWDKFRTSPLRQALERVWPPIGVGLMLSGPFVIRAVRLQEPERHLLRRHRHSHRVGRLVAFTACTCF